MNSEHMHWKFWLNQFIDISTIWHKSKKEIFNTKEFSDLTIWAVVAATVILHTKRVNGGRF